MHTILDKYKRIYLFLPIVAMAGIFILQTPHADIMHASVHSACLRPAATSESRPVVYGTLRIGTETIPASFTAESFRNISRIIRQASESTRARRDLAMQGLAILAENMRRLKTHINELREQFGNTLADEAMKKIDAVVGDLEYGMQAPGDAARQLRRCCDVLEDLGITEKAHYNRLDEPYILTFLSISRDLRDVIQNEELQRILREIHDISIFSGWFYEHMHAILVEGNVNGIMEESNPEFEIRMFVFKNFVAPRMSVDAEDMMHFRVPPGTVFPRVQWCKRQILMAVAELIKNAQAHAHDFASTVGVSIEGGGLVIEVIDRGPGISEETRKIMELLCYTSQPIESMPDDISGYGLGVAKVNAYAQFYGGRVEYISRERGATARIVLPLENLVPAAHATPLPETRAVSAQPQQQSAEST